MAGPFDIQVVAVTAVRARHERDSDEVSGFHAGELILICKEVPGKAGGALPWETVLEGGRVGDEGDERGVGEMEVWGRKFERATRCNR